jgi:hypothetical protein
MGVNRYRPDRPAPPEELAVPLSDEQILARIQEADKQNRALERQARLAFGERRPQIICPHCQTIGQVRTTAIKKKAGISGGKTAVAVSEAGGDNVQDRITMRSRGGGRLCRVCKPRRWTLQSNRSISLVHLTVLHILYVSDRSAWRTENPIRRRVGMKIDQHIAFWPLGNSCLWRV